MARQLPTRQASATRVVHYIDAADAGLTYLTGAELAARRQRDRQLYLRWKERQAAIAANDATARRFWLGFGAVIATAVLVGMVLLGWLVWHYLTAINLGVLAVPVIIAAAGALAFGGHRCITIVQHWH